MISLMHKHKPHIVILGAGFGGVYTLLNLARRLRPGEAKITIINRHNYFLFTPLLHEAATGGLAHHNVVESLRAIIEKYKVELVVGEIEKIETAQKIVRTSICLVPYDKLIIATGSTTNFYNVPGAEENTLVLKDLYGAIKLRNAVITAVENSVHAHDPAERRRLLNFVIIGGGATGVELSAEMAQWFFSTFKRFYSHAFKGHGMGYGTGDQNIRKNGIAIHLATQGDEILNQFHPRLRAGATKILKEKNVELHFRSRAIKVEPGKVFFEDGSVFEVATIIWVAGVRPICPPSDISFKRDKHGRLAVDRSLKLVDQPDIFALGDVASIELETGENVPMLAQVAVIQAKILAKNVLNSIRGRPFVRYKYRKLGDLLSLGHWQAVADILGTRWSGPLAWFIWRTVYLNKYLSCSKKLRVAIDWTIDLFYPRDITKA